MNASLSSLRLCGRALRMAALLALPALGYAQTALYQWNFDGNTLTPTTSGGVTGGTLVITNNGGTTAGLVNGAGVSGASGDYAVDLTSGSYGSPNSPSVLGNVGSIPSTNAVTVTMWIKMPDWSTVYSSATGNTFSRLLQLTTTAGAENTSVVYFSLYHASGQNGIGFQSGINLNGVPGSINNPINGYLPSSGSAWAFVAMTYDASLSTNTMANYVGGTSTSVTQAGSSFSSTTSAVPSSIVQVSIGNGPSSPPAQRQFDGLIDDVRIYNTALTLSQLDAVRLSASPIPEPSTYAAILGGLALTGVMIRRRYRRA